MQNMNAKRQNSIFNMRGGKITARLMGERFWNFNRQARFLIAWGGQAGVIPHHWSFSVCRTNIALFHHQYISIRQNKPKVHTDEQETGVEESPQPMGKIKLHHQDKNQHPNLTYSQYLQGEFHLVHIPDWYC